MVQILVSRCVVVMKKLGSLSNHASKGSINCDMLEISNRRKQTYAGILKQFELGEPLGFTKDFLMSLTHGFKRIKDGYSSVSKTVTQAYTWS